MKAGKVLIVDDEPAIVEMLSVNLAGSGYEIETAFDGEEALEKLTSSDKKTDVVILDVILPKLNGYEVARRIKSNAETAETPIIMLTAKDRPLDKVMGMIDCEVDYYLTKPVDISDLLIRVMKITDKKYRPKTK
jgi:two-component system response regulator VicR